ncbi:protein phosphatase 1 regulatory subunit 16A-like isoform X2 [Pollicipes pollicipes]|uniref:protein phosphatase 1 regulatory subunit 16A-like isoform X2 n=1 Tax=Pollicipes pollicipes TaxID=41117 RepID=UPI001885408D|nr:protein phosphatase 1 regulatory subunit 16A-like isoform X2 [Pollicipes pollicipes]
MVLRGSMEHDDLIREMPLIEKLSTQERLKLARRRRKEQLRRFFAREKEAGSKRHKGAENRSQRRRQADARIHFVDSVMLLEAAARSDIDEVRRLLSLGVDPNSTNEDGLTALHQCCIDDSEAMMALLLDHGANVDAKDSERWTPLHAAATCGHLHLVKQLVERGANLLAVNADGNMAYDICEDDTTLEYIETQMARRGVTQELIEQTRGEIEAAMLEDLKQRPMSALEERVQQSATPLHIAAANGYITVVEYLLDNHVCVDARDKDDWQPIHAAACWSHPQVIELLYQNGADLSAATRSGETPFDVCEDPEIRERLEQLKTEQDLKRTETQRPRVRRTQSTKHSIRRTSMREKTLTPKKDVKQEARIRLGVEESISALEDSNRRVDASLLDVDGIAIELADDTSQASSANKSEDLTDGVSTATEDQNGTDLTKRADGQVTAGQVNGARVNGSQVNGGQVNGSQVNGSQVNGGHVNSSERPTRDSSRTSVGSSASVESSKIDIHVHVTVNTGVGGGGGAGGGGAGGGGGNGGGGEGAPPAYTPPTYTASYSHGPLQGTLADLKKQRALSRSALTGAIALSAFPLDELGPAAVSPMPSPAADSPPVPRRRFVTGDGGLVTSELPREKTGCCWLQ